MSSSGVDFDSESEVSVKRKDLNALLASVVLMQLTHKAYADDVKKLKRRLDNIDKRLDETDKQRNQAGHSNDQQDAADSHMEETTMATLTGTANGNGTEADEQGETIGSNNKGAGCEVRKSVNQPLLLAALEQLGSGGKVDLVKDLENEWKILVELVILLMQSELKWFKQPIVLTDEVVCGDALDAETLDVHQIIEMQPMPVSAALLSGYYVMSLGVLYGDEVGKKIVLDSLPTLAQFVTSLKEPKVDDTSKTQK